MTKILFFTAVLLGIFSLAENSQAATINVVDASGQPSCEQVDVQTAVNSAVSGDSILMSTGECVWTNGVTINNKAIFIIGAGIGQTVIMDNISDTWASALFWTDACADNLRLSGMTINRSSSRTNASIAIRGNCKNWRIDHIAFNASAMTGVTRAIMVQSTTASYPHPSGLIDHFSYNKLGSTSASPVIIMGADDAVTKNDAWSQDINWGGSDWVFIEDSIFDFSAVYGQTNSFQDGAIDCGRGAKYVFRHNIVKGTEIGGHGYDSSPRSCLAMEIYNNQISNNGANPTQAIHLRGGTAYIYDNAITGNYRYAIGLQNYRSCSESPCFTSAVNQCQNDTKDWCDGNTVANINQLGDGNTFPAGTYHGWPCRDQIGRGPNQTSSPLYQWNNTKDNSIVISPTVRDAGAGTCYTMIHIQAERDYFNSTPSGYTPYAYPHPLTIIADTTPPAPPSGLIIN
ncbi:MAG: hypothetical protein WCV70_04235 [Patescibacteria group bacterium]